MVGDESGAYIQLDSGVLVLLKELKDKVRYLVDEASLLL